MKTFNQEFTQKLAGAATSPVTLAVLGNGTSELHVSDRYVDTVDGPEFAGLVTKWEAVTDAIAGGSGLRMPETALELADYPGSAASEFLAGSAVQNITVELYQWFVGLSYAKREPIGRFAVKGPVERGDGRARFTLAGALMLRDLTVGNLIGRDEYPDADPDAIGRMENIVYGSVEGLFCHPVDAGAATRLVADIDDVQTGPIMLSMSVDETPMPGSGTLQIGAEKITYTGISGKTLTGVSRGAGGTVPMAHKKGATAFEVRDEYTYLVAGHPVKSIGDVYVGGVRVSSGVTKSTDDYGKAKLVFSSRFTIEKSVDLGVTEGSHEHSDDAWAGEGTRHASYSYRWTAATSPGWTTGEHVGKAFRDPAGHYFYIYANGSNYVDVASIHGQSLAAGTYTGQVIRTQVQMVRQDTLSETYSAPYAGSPTALCDGNWNDYCTIANSSGYIKTTRSAPVSDSGIIVGAKLAATFGNPVAGSGSGAKSEFSGGPFNGQSVTGGGSSAQTVRTANTLTKGAVCTWADFSGSVLKAYYPISSSSGSFWEHWVEVFFIPYGGGASPATGVSLTGSSAADVVVGVAVTCDAEGYADDGNGTFTGSADALIENPADVAAHFMSVVMGVPAGEIGTSFADARDAMSGMRLAGAIRAPGAALDILRDIAGQSMLSVSHDGFVARAALAEAGPRDADWTITPDKVVQGSVSVEHAGRDEVINKLSVHYRPDLSASGGGSGNFLGLADSSEAYPASGDADSIAVYGEAAPSVPVKLGFVRDADTASGIRDFTLTRSKDAPRRARFACFLYNMAIEPGDVVELSGGWPVAGISGAMFEVESAALMPGSARDGRPDTYHVAAREVL